MLGFGSHLLLASMSIEMSSSTIIDLWPFGRWRDIPSDVNGGVGRLYFFRYGPSDLASLDRFWIFSLDHREENYPCNICPGCYVIDNGDSYSRLPSDIDQVVRLFCPVILVLVLLPILIDYFNSCARVCSLDIATQKIIGELSLVFTNLWFDICSSKKYKIVSWKKKEFEDIC
jgi:hypothetical protein